MRRLVALPTYKSHELLIGVSHTHVDQDRLTCYFRNQLTAANTKLRKAQEENTLLEGNFP
jgi:hypothetical protein